MLAPTPHLVLYTAIPRRSNMSNVNPFTYQFSVPSLLHNRTKQLSN
ncbi:uncharacterized protein METZ01_LOCUS333795, partial [marine metagenome]